jgi:hypothetical protein
MSVFVEKLRKSVVDRKERLAEYILTGVMEMSKYHNLCGQHTALLLVERDIEEILNQLKVEDEEED